MQTIGIAEMAFFKDCDDLCTKGYFRRAQATHEWTPSNANARSDRSNEVSKPLFGLPKYTTPNFLEGKVI